MLAHSQCERDLASARIVCFVASLLCTSAVGCGSGTRSYEGWWQLGAVQVFEGRDEVWIFTEADRRVRRPGALVEPTVVSLGHRQRVVALGCEGVKFSSDLVGDAATFNHNLSELFRWHGRFYCMQISSGGRPPHLWEWEGDRFAYVEANTSNEILDSLELLDATPSELPQLLDRVTRADGWRRVLAENQPTTTALSRASMKGAAIDLSLERSGDSEFLIAQGASDVPDAGRWTATIMQADLTRTKLSEAEYERAANGGQVKLPCGN